MTEQLALFTVEPEYCIDTNVIVSFLSETDDEFYGADVFEDHWRRIEKLISSGRIIAPRQVEHELEGHAEKRAKVGPWLKAHGYMFRDVDTDAQLHFAKQVVNKYPAYGRSENFLGDLTVISLAGAMGITVISLEAAVAQSGQKHPKIPNVCAEFGVDCLSVSGFFRRVLKQAVASTPG